MAQEVNFKIQFDSNGQTVMGQLKVSAQDLTAAVAAASKGIDKDFKRMTATMSSTVVALQGMANAFQQLAEPVISFDQAMRAANTMAGKTGAEFEALTGQIKGLSKEIPIARDLLANGLYQTISNGVPEDNWISFLEQSAKSSVGGMADLNEVVKVTSTIIKNYGYSWEDATAIQDKIQLTAKNGVTSFEQLAQALPKVTGNAATLGVQIDELMATFSTLTGVSGNTAEVSTQLSAIFTSLIKPSKEAQKMAQAMGIEFNAASIKAAGGLQNFLSSLDQAVKQYAEANGVLEQAVYGKLFGSAEALRAVGPLIGNLSDKFSENIDAMSDSAGTMESAYSFMADSLQSSIQRAKNAIADWTGSIAVWAAEALPTIQIMASMTIAITGLKSVFVFARSVIIAFDAVVKTSAIGLKMHNMAINASSKAFYALPKRVSGAIASIVGLGNASRGAALAVRGMAFALKGLLAATGIGLAIVAITTAMDLFSKKTDEAKEKAEESKRAFNDWKKSLTDTSSHVSQAIAQEMTQLERLYKTATNETKSRKERLKAAKELKETYKDTFANLTTEEILVGKAAKAYDGLKKSIMEAAKAKAAQSMIEQNQSEWLAKDFRKNQIEQRKAELKQELHDAKSRLVDVKTFDQSHEVVMRPGMSSLGGSSGHLADNTTKKYRDAKNAVANLQSEQDALDQELKEIENTQKAIAEANDYLENVIESSPTSTNNLDSLLNGNGDRDKDTKKTLKQKLEAQLSEAKDKYVQASIKGNEAEAKSQLDVIDNLKTQIVQIEAIEKTMERPKTLLTIGDINKELQYQRALRENATAENIAGIDREIERLEKLRQQIENTGKTVKPIEEIETYEDLNAALSYYDAKLKTALPEEREEIQKLILELQRLKVAWDEALAEVNAPGDISTLDTEDKIDEAITYYENKLKKATKGQRAAIQKVLNELYDAKGNLGNVSTIQNYQDEIDKLKGLDKNALTMRIRLMGADQINSKIKDMKAMLMDPDIPEELKEQLRGIISQWEQYKNMAQSSTEVATQGLSIVGGAFKDLGGIFDNALGKWLNYVGQMMDSIAKLIPAIMAVTAAHAAESAAQTPIIGWLAVGGAIAATIASFAQIPKFADGGIAYGPTVGLFGEYAGASNNPEVVAPLDKLRSMLQPQGIMAGKVEFEIKGRVLKGVLKKVESLDLRS